MASCLDFVDNRRRKLKTSLTGETLAEASRRKARRMPLERERMKKGGCAGTGGGPFSGLRESLCQHRLTLLLATDHQS